MTRRTVICSLDAKMERPELRQFDFEPVQRAKNRRPQLVVAALTILRAFKLHGRPSAKPPLGSFEQWSSLTVMQSYGSTWPTRPTQWNKSAIAILGSL